MKEMSFLEMLNNHPVAGAMFIALLLIVQKIVATWRGNSVSTQLERETNKLARQTSETVNRCSERTGELMAATKDVIIAIEKHLAENNVRHLHSRLDAALHMLEEMANNKDLHRVQLERLGDLCGNIVSDLKLTDSRVVHSDILHRIEQVESTCKDIKRISIEIAKQ
jgi:hypothetical protein